MPALEGKTAFVTGGIRAAMVAVLSLPHYGEPCDIAGMAAFLAGPEGRQSRAPACPWTAATRREGVFCGLRARCLHKQKKLPIISLLRTTR